MANVEVQPAPPEKDNPDAEKSSEVASVDAGKESDGEEDDEGDDEGGAVWKIGGKK